MIDINTGFNMIMQNKPIETKLVLTKEQMKNMDSGSVPDSYIALCSDDNNLYTFSKNNPVDSSTGLYKLYATLDTGWNPPAPGERTVIYGFRLDSKASDPKDIVTYLPDCDNYEFTPIGGTSDWYPGLKYGSWPKDDFFMPRPCMLKYDGTVDYYLVSTNFNLKEDGTESDIQNPDYEGNAMLEWGRDGNQIWYKIVPKDDGLVADVYFSNKQVDPDYHAWSFIGRDHTKPKTDPDAYVLKEHFYTALLPIQTVENPVSNTVTDDCPLNGRHVGYWQGYDYKSLEDIMNGINAKYGDDSGWLIDTYSDRILITLLTILLTKTVNIRNVVGCETGDIDNFPSLKYNGMLNDITFFGSTGYHTNDNAFFMPFYLGTLPKYTLGLTYQPTATSDAPQGQFTYKLCLGKSDGSETDTYNLTGEGYHTCDNPDKPAKTTGSSGHSLAGLYFENSGIMLPGMVRNIDYMDDSVIFDNAGITVEPEEYIGLPLFGSSYENSKMSIFEFSIQRKSDRPDDCCGASLSYR